MIRSLILSYYLINLSFASPLVSLVVFVLFIFSLLGKSNSQPKPQSVSSWVILAFRGVIVILPTLITTLSLLMSPPLRIPPPLQHVLFQMSYLFLLSYHHQIPLLHLQMSCLDHFRLYSSSSSSFLLNHLLCHSHLLLRFCNHLMIYLLPIGKVPALLLTHILFIIFSTFIVYIYPTLSLFPPCLLSLPLKAILRLSLTQDGNRQWLRKWFLFTTMANRSLLLFLLASLPLVVIGFIQ